MQEIDPTGYEGSIPIFFVLLPMPKGGAKEPRNFQNRRPDCLQRKECTQTAWAI